MKCDKGTGIFAQGVKMNIHESGGESNKKSHGQQRCISYFKTKAYTW